MTNMSSNYFEIKGNNHLPNYPLKIKKFSILESIDQIVESLSSQTEPCKLQDVAKKLLMLQRMINLNINSIGNNLSNQLRNNNNENRIPNFKNISATQPLDLTQETRPSASYSPNNRPSIQPQQKNDMSPLKSSYTTNSSTGTSLNQNTFGNGSASPFRSAQAT